MTKKILKRERVEGLIWLVLGVGLSTASIQLRLGNLHRPGPGFMPFLSGALLGVFGLVLLFFPPAETPDEGEAASTGKDWRSSFSPVSSFSDTLCSLSLWGFLPRASFSSSCYSNLQIPGGGWLRCSCLEAPWSRVTSSSPFG
jgi:hypothetical protein